MVLVLYYTVVAENSDSLRHQQEVKTFNPETSRKGHATTLFPKGLMNRNTYHVRPGLDHSCRACMRGARDLDP